MRLGLLKSKIAAEVASVFKSARVDDLERPETIHSDQGTEFWGRDFRQLLVGLGIKHSFTTDYHPAGDGQVERNFQTVASMLSTTLVGPRNGWPEAVLRVQNAYNEAQHAFTGYPPDFLFSGVENKQKMTQHLVVQPQPSPEDERTRLRILLQARKSVKEKVEIKLKNLETYNRTSTVSF